MSALADLRVLDISGSIGGAWCSRWLADFGADVLTIEPAAGHPVRLIEPFDSRGRSVLASYVLANKKSVAIEREQPGAEAIIHQLLAHADVLIYSSASSLAEWKISVQTITADFPRLIALCMAPYGEGNDRSDWKSNDLALYAVSGWASLNGLADREPLKGSGYTASFTAGTTAYGAVLAALIQREADGLGQVVESAEVDGLMSMFGRALLLAQYEGSPPVRASAPGLRSVYPVPTSDGYISLVLGSGERFRDAMLALGLHDLADDESLGDPKNRTARAAEWEPRVLEAIARGKQRELFENISDHRVAAGIVLTMADVVQDPHLQERDYWVEVADSGGVERFPGAPARLSRTPWSLRNTMPDVGADTSRVLKEWCGMDERTIVALNGQQIVKVSR